MKKISIFILLAIFTSCNEESIDSESISSTANEIKENPNINSTTNQNNEVYEQDFEYTEEGGYIVRAKLHRGKKWTARENEKRMRQGRLQIAPCSRSWGVCGVSFFGSDLQIKRIELKFNPDLQHIDFVFRDTIEILYEDDEVRQVSNGDIFISDEDGYFSFPIELSKDIYGENEERFISIIPDNYITEFNEEYPFGHVIVNYELTENEY